MKLYMFPVAPNPTKVRLYLAEKKAAGVEIPIEQVVVDFREKQQLTAEHRARNPLGKVPVLDPDFQNLCRWDAAYRERSSAKEVLVL